ncbi:MAG TPA: AI-2E family transporter [Gallionellaceae bacterium]|nr:AI-2E family transporter [Gallionellaceae bacterium]
MERFVALQWIAITAAISWLLYLLEPILMPFVAAAILAYICDPWVSRLCALRLPLGRKLPRTLAALMVMAALLGLLALLILIMLPLLQKEFSHFISRLPALLDLARLKLLPILQEKFNVSLQWDNEVLKSLLSEHWQSAGGAAAKVLPWLGGSGAMLLALLMNALLIPLVLFYLLRDWPLLMARIEAAIPRRLHAKVLEIAAEIDRILAEFLRGQMSVMLLMSTYYVLCLWLAGLEFALPIGIVAGMLVFVPYLGMLSGLALATLAAFTQFDHVSSIVLVWGVFGLGQLLEGMAITPWLVGDRIGLHPLAVIFSLLAFGQLFGFFGLLLALPLSAALLVGLRHASRWYLHSSLYKD